MPSMDPTPHRQTLDALIASLRPTLHGGVYVFCAVSRERSALADLDVIATFSDAEGLTLVLEENIARDHGLEPRFRAAWITLGVNSDFADVGLTAAVATALAQAGIACNVIAAVHHDHLFVPWERGEEALGILEGLARRR